MASIFQKIKEKGEPYFFEYTDHLGRRRQKKGFADRRDTERMAAEYEKKAKLRREGLLDPADEKFAEERKKPLAVHLADYEASLKAKRRSEKHIRLTLSRVRKAFDGCGYHMITDFDALEVEQKLAELAEKEDHGPRTFNHYLQSICGFCNWMKRSQRLRSNPFDGMTRLNTKKDVRHVRRPLSPDEISKMVNGAKNSGERVQAYDGELRVRVYVVAYYTGLRQKEISALTPQSFRLKTATPAVILDAKFTKNGEPAEIPLHPVFKKILEEWLPTMPTDEPLFPRFARKKAWLMVKKDLARVGIPYANDDGIADFHSLRASFIKYVMKGGGTIVEAQKLARHSDVRITGGYADANTEDRATAISNLQALEISGPWNSQHSVQPDRPRSSSKVSKKSTAPDHSNGAAPTTSVRDGAQESGVGNDCHQPRQKWRRRESNLRRILLQRYIAERVTCTRKIAGSIWGVRQRHTVARVVAI